ncbi:uncharacterized protein LOC133784819 [Humulus lupulus]|uniref:uncharacterized protein LOC133784819 n=1 Tax=Humulus lupulus TaxID=3486 RepID=UPI002B4128D2|nr:uncharacterized protein LOC133784819 [Humulus lupulus]
MVKTKNANRPLLPPASSLSQSVGLGPVRPSPLSPTASSLSPTVLPQVRSTSPSSSTPTGSPPSPKGMCSPPTSLPKRFTRSSLASSSPSTPRSSPNPSNPPSSKPTPSSKRKSPSSSPKSPPKRPKKTSRVPATSSIPPTTTTLHHSQPTHPFCSDHKLLRYRDEVSQRKLWFEYNVVIDDFPLHRALIESRGWLNTVTNLTPPCPTLVREFYANIDKRILSDTSALKYRAYIRGKRFPFSPSIVSRVLSVTKELSPAFNSQFTPSKLEMGVALTGSASFEWGTGDLPVPALSHFYKVLHRIALNNWLPNTHTTSITTEISKFLFAVGTGVSIDLPTLIFGKIVDAALASGTRNVLPFPCLVHQIALRSGPTLTLHDVPSAVPSFGKSCKALKSKQVLPTDSSPPDPSSPPPGASATTIKGLAPSSWQVQLVNRFVAFEKRYDEDQQRQRAFESRASHPESPLVSDNTPGVSEATPVVPNAAQVAPATTFMVPVAKSSQSQGECVPSASAPAHPVAPSQGELSSAGHGPQIQGERSFDITPAALNSDGAPKVFMRRLPKTRSGRKKYDL